MEDGIAIISNNGKYGLYDAIEEKFILPLEYDLINYKNGAFKLFNSNQYRIGAYVPTGNLLIEPIFEELNFLKQGYFTFKANHRMSVSYTHLTLPTICSV